MPKLKKQPHNAYYFFMVDRKQRLEARGQRFLGGMKEVAEVVRDEWRLLPQHEKSHFENLAAEAKEEEKFNLHNKFTVTGESYAQIHERESEDKRTREQMESYINQLTIKSTTPPETRNFLLIKTIHSCFEHQEDRYWPLELALGVFNLRDGLKSNYTTLIDTREAPFGFASTVKETSEDTSLPTPGSPIFKPSECEYKRILTNVKRFIEKFLEEYPREYVLFAMDSELKPAEGCLRWLYNNSTIDDAEVPAWQHFFKNLRFYKLSKLVLRFALIAKARNPEYNTVMVLYPELEQAAITLLNEGRYDYRDDITCQHHRLDENSYKMNICCRNVVLRRIYLILGHMVPAMKLPVVMGHDIEKFAERSSSCKPSQQMPPRIAQLPKEDMKPDDEDEDLAAVWGNAKSRFAANPKPEPKKDDYDDGQIVSSGFVVGASRNTDLSFGLFGVKKETTFDDDDFPALGSTSKSSTTWGSGRGRGGGSSSQKEAYDDDMPGPSKSLGRGRGIRGRGK